MCLYVYRNNPLIEPAYVLSVSEDGISVLVPRFGIEGAVSLVQESKPTAATLAKGKAVKAVKKYNYNIRSAEFNAAQHAVTLQLEGGKSVRLQVFQQISVRLLTTEKSSGYRVLAIDLVHEHIPAPAAPVPTPAAETALTTPSVDGKRPNQGESHPTPGNSKPNKKQKK